ncbi:arylsulfatase A-like enzyme [Arthrobacter sp. UYCu723]
MEASKARQPGGYDRNRRQATPLLWPGERKDEAMSNQPVESRPNFVVILTDDQGRWAMPHRMPELVMPHMERFLEESLELDRMYCASPVCSPSRASMMTGRMPSAHGVHDWLIGGRHPDAHPDRYLEGQPTTPEVLDDAGYQCAMSGKWHVGHSQEPAPGFEFWFAHRYGGGPYYGAPIWRDGQPATEPAYFTDAVAENALDFLATRDRRRPFYLQVNFTAPHDPWIDNHPQELVDLYADTDFPSVPREQPHPWVEPRKADFADAFADPHPHLAGYCASLTAVDRSLGRIRSLLQEEGVSGDTVVVSLSDNGFSCGHHGIWGKGNGTYPLNFWENSVRVPCVVHVPAAPREPATRCCRAFPCTTLSVTWQGLKFPTIGGVRVPPLPTSCGAGAPMVRTSWSSPVSTAGRG